MEYHHSRMADLERLAMTKVDKDTEQTELHMLLPGASSMGQPL